MSTLVTVYFVVAAILFILFSVFVPLAVTQEKQLWAALKLALVWPYTFYLVFAEK